MEVGGSSRKYIQRIWCTMSDSFGDFEACRVVRHYVCQKTMKEGNCDFVGMGSLNIPGPKFCHIWN